MCESMHAHAYSECVLSHVLSVIYAQIKFTGNITVEECCCVGYLVFDYSVYARVKFIL